MRDLKTKIFLYIEKNDLAYYNAGVVAVHSKFVGLTPDIPPMVNLFCVICARPGRL
jgi:hypothetical protein